MLIKIIKSILCFYFMTISNHLIFSQNTPPKYSENLNGNGLRSLFFSLDDSLSKEINLSCRDTCISDLGLFRFVIDKYGNVEIREFKGSLLKIIKDKIEKNILNTSGHWIPEMQNGEAVESKSFLYLFDFYICRRKTMHKLVNKDNYLTPILYQIKNVLEGGNQEFIDTGNGYIFPIAIYKTSE
jgi:hypothetical protein